MEVVQSVSQSYLTQLWSNDVFQKKINQKHKTITDAVSRYFTPVLLLIAFAGFGYWLFFDTQTAFNVFTAVLIVACPCALALTAPFTFGNVLRILGKKKCYLKNALVIEQMAKVDTLVFDKTGTITTTQKTTINYVGKPISTADLNALKNVLRVSNHPLSRMVYDYLPEAPKQEVTAFTEHTGKGIDASCAGKKIQLGSASFLGQTTPENLNQTQVHVAIDGQYVGCFVFHNHYREGLAELFAQLAKTYTLKVVSGDNEGERETLQQLLPAGTELVFNQKPEQKLAFIKQLQENGSNVMMIGDGLNDAGALAQSNMGMAISENVNVFSPACDAILDASQFAQLGGYLRLAKDSIITIKMSFTLSIVYNIVGLSFAVSGQLEPIVAAIIMPLSTITIVSFVTVMSNYFARKTEK
jgi:Cu+-exporting ATPase